MKSFATLFLLLSFGMCRAELPELFRKHDFNAAILAEAVNHYVTLGEERAIRELSTLAPDYISERKISADIGEGVDLAERLGWVCRILFQPNGKAPLRGPLIGGLDLPYLTMPARSWPLLPIAASGHSYFVLDDHLSLAGVPEDMRDYLAYCRAKGVFRSKRIPVPTRAEAQADALALRNSHRWQVIKWTDSAPGRSYTFGEADTYDFIKAQADSIK